MSGGKCPESPSACNDTPPLGLMVTRVIPQLAILIRNQASGGN